MMQTKTNLNSKQRTWLISLQSEDVLLLLIPDGLHHIDDVDSDPTHGPWGWQTFQIKKWINNVIRNDGYVLADVDWLNTLRLEYFKQANKQKKI